MVSGCMLLKYYSDQLQRIKCSKLCLGPQKKSKSLVNSSVATDIFGASAAIDKGRMLKDALSRLLDINVELAILVHLKYLYNSLY